MMLLDAQIAKARADALAVGLVQMHEVEKVLAERLLADRVERDLLALDERHDLGLTYAEDTEPRCVEVRRSVLVWEACETSLFGDPVRFVSNFDGQITRVLSPRNVRTA